MNFVDLKSQYARIKPQIRERIEAVLDHGQYINGPEVGELESLLADYVGVKHCICVSSGTDALLVAMMALDVGHGDEVITTPFTFIATGEMISLLGATPVFVDIDLHTYNIDPERIAAAITPKTRAIMPVSLYGQCADFDHINDIAEKHGLPVIEDAAQSLGATYKERRSCGLSTIGCTSFFPSKPLGGYGDAGACFTNDDEVARAMREIRNHGQDRRYHHPRIGLNARIDTLQAAVLLAKMEIFPQEVALRHEIGNRYSEMISARWQEIVVPFIADENTSVYAQYTIQVEDRTDTAERMKRNGVPSAIHYPVPLNQQPALRTDLFDLEVSERLSQRVISLPMHPYLTAEDMARVVESLG